MRACPSSRLAAAELGAVVDRAALAAVQAPFGSARPLPLAVYVDQRVFRFEREVLFPASFLPLGRSSAIAAPSSFARPPSPLDVLLSRSADLELRAFHNLCRHRGAELVTSSGGRASGFTCPYHGYRYDLRGRLEHAPFGPAGADPRELDLAALDVAQLGDLVFARSVAPPPGAAFAHADVVRAAPPWLRETELRHLATVHAASWTTAANWKLVVENFQESHHFPFVHRALETLTPSDEARSVLGAGPWLGGTMRITETETVSASGSFTGRPLVVAPALAGQVHDAMLFPLFLSSLQPDYLLTYRLVPRAVDATLVHFEIHAHPSLAAVPPEAEPIVDLVTFWSRVNDEDRRIVESQQRAMSGAPGVSLPAFATVEDGVHAFQSRVAAFYEAAIAEVDA